MVSIIVSKKALLQTSGAKLNDVELEDALLQIKCSLEAYDKATDELTIEVTGDRPDLLSAAGVARALSGWLGNAKGIPPAKYSKPKWTLHTEPSALSVRPYILGAIVRNAKFDDELIAQMFNQQEKLALTHGRKRKKVSVGAWDILNLTPPFHFKCVPGTTMFQPLKFDKPVALKDVLSEHPKGKEYSSLLPAGKYPVLTDSKGEIIAIIPVSNGVSTAVTTKTTAFGIDAEGSDFAACNAALAIMCQDYLDLGWSVEPLSVVYPTRTVVTPQVDTKSFKFTVEQANKALGTSLTSTQVVKAVHRVRLDATASGNMITAIVPSYRPDFMHLADVFEEVAIGFGFNNIEPKRPTTFTEGSLSQKTMEEIWLRDFFLGAGFLELSTHVLTNERRVKLAGSVEELVEISNPVSMDYHALRGSLLPNMIQVLSENTHRPYPQKIFEIGEVVVPDSKLSEKMRTVRRACLVSAHAQGSLTEAASVLLELSKRLGKKLLLKPIKSHQFIEGRSCKVEFDGVAVGTLGEIHPQVLTDFGISVPAVAFEVDC